MSRDTSRRSPHPVCPTFVSYVCLLCRDGTLLGAGAQDWCCPTLPAQSELNGVNYTPLKRDLTISGCLRRRFAHTKKAHNRTQPGTGLNVLNKLMKSTHRTQGGHDKNLYSCETQPSRESASSEHLFICLFDGPRRSARGAGGPTKVRCQRGEREIERRGMSYGERWEIAAREWRSGRLGAGSVGGWVGGFGNTERTSFLLLLVKQR